MTLGVCIGGEHISARRACFAAVKGGEKMYRVGGSTGVFGLS